MRGLWGQEVDHTAARLSLAVAKQVIPQDGEQYPVWRSLVRAADYMPYLLLIDLPRVNADADPPDEAHQPKGST